MRYASCSIKPSDFSPFGKRPRQRTDAQGKGGDDQTPSDGLTAVLLRSRPMIDALTTGSLPTGLAPADLALDAFRADVRAGLARSPKTLPCKYFYDRRGSQLFDDICRLPEYYLTRCELAIMQRHAADMADVLGPLAMLLELGSGSSVKVRLLLDELDEPAAYVPIDISREHLLATAHRLQQDYPGLEILPAAADFTERLWAPTPRRTPRRRVVYFPGSTLGNFRHGAARRILRRIASLCGPGGALLLGVDLEKDPATIEAAYNDAAGVTAQFNLNLLRRINRELDADFELDGFEHRAFYDRRHKRVDIRLESLSRQLVRIGPERYRFDRNEAIRTEYSHKYTIEGLAALAAPAGLTLRRYWTDDRRYFAVAYLTRD
jgi:dimethylhistidine N-methyltransferase